MPVTPNLALPYPGMTDAPNAPAQLQALANAVDALGSPWTTYSTTWLATTTNPTLGSGSIVAKWIRKGAMVQFKIRVVFGSTTDPGSGFYNFTRPIAGIVGTWDALGAATVVDTSLSDRRGWTCVDAGGGFLSAVDNNGARLGHNSPFNWAVGDVIFLTGLYEIAF